MSGGKAFPDLKDGTTIDKCDKCDGDLKVRTNSENGSRFLGCTNYPTCRNSRELDTFFRMKAIGAPRLPGF